MTEREKLEAEKAKIQAQIDALPKVQTVTEEARERIAVECVPIASAKQYRDGDYDHQAGMRAMVKIVQELRDMTAGRDGLLAENVELKASSVTSEPVLVDPRLPLEAYHPDGRVVDVQSCSVDADGCIWIKNHDAIRSQGGRDMRQFKPTGEHRYNVADWRIRNKAVQS